VVLAFAAIYWPGYRAGGPVRTMRNLVAALRDDVDFRIFTANHDRGESRPYTEVPTNRWTEVDGARVFYADRAARRAGAICRLAAEIDPDVVYINSFFDPVFSVRPVVLHRLGRLAPRARWVIAPRGEFAAAALSIKAWKKRPYLAASRLAGLHRGMTWQATSEFEVADIGRIMGPSPESIRLATNIPELPAAAEPAAEPPAGGPLRVCFLSRITPMKNLAFAIEALKDVPRPIRFDVYGPVLDAAYWAKCRQALPAAGGRLEVRVHGEVAHEHVRETLAGHDLFLLPTLGENFGHVILEALAAGVPVLISDRTPWRDLEARGVGWALSLDDRAAFTRTITECADMLPAERATMRERARRYAADVAASSDVVAANRALFMP
jgi:glycosyltransferase involved in cell wall biosynthesis